MFFNYYVFEVNFELRQCDASSFVIFAQDCFAIWVIVTDNEFLDCFSMSVKIFLRILIEIVSKLNNHEDTDKFLETYQDPIMKKQKI
jgi:hypothetical protein